MPIYEYSCQKCGTIEVTQKITDNPLTKCPTCKSKVKKLISNTSFQLKGTGWYVTDYARKDNGAGKKENGSAKPSESKKESKTDSTTSGEKSSTAPSSSSSSSTSA